MRHFWHGICSWDSMARKPRIIQTEHPYHLVCRTNNRSFRFLRNTTIRLFARTLREVLEKYGLQVHHFVLMANHYHIIATATEHNLHRAMQYLNSRVAVRSNRAVRRTGHLWGDRYKSCILATDDYYKTAVRYVYRNPLRAKIVKHLQDFEDSSFQFWAFGKKIDMALHDDHLVLNMGGDRKKVHWYFKTLVLDEGTLFPQDDQVKTALRRMFYGSADFFQRMKDKHLTH